MSRIADHIVVNCKRVLRDQEHVPDAARRAPPLRQHHDDHREREARSHAGDYLRHCCRHDDAAHRLAPGDAVRPGRLHQRRLDAADAVNRVEEDREEAEERDECDLLLVEDPQQHDRDREECRRRHRSPVLDVRHRPQARPAREADRNPQAHTGDDCDTEAEGDPFQAGEHVRPELGEEPQILELGENRRQAWELRVVGRRRPQLPGGEDQDRDGDLRADDEDPIRARAHGSSTRCEGCQRKARRSRTTIA